MRNGFLDSFLLLSLIGGVAAAGPLPGAPAPDSGGPFSVRELPPPPGEVVFFAPDAFADGQGGGQFWVRAEYLWWWVKDGDVPPLVTSGTPASGGALGAPGTTTLVGGGVDYGARQGARVTAGGLLDADATVGVELGYFCLGGDADRFRATSSGAAGSRTLGRPFFNVINGQQGVQIVTLPGVAGGGVGTSSDTSLRGADLNFFCNICRTPVCPPDPCQPACGPVETYRLDMFAGPRWLSLNEEVAVAEQVITPGATFSIVDSFQTRNTFYGGQVGVRGEWQRGQWFVNGMAKVAVGNTRQEVTIAGTTSIAVPGAGPNVQQGGLLALPTNIGHYSRDRFTVIPELGVNVGCQVTPCLRAYAGYSCLYWNRVVRPGDQIDVGINPTQLPSAAGPGELVGPRRPAFAFRETDFWAHGVSAGLEFRW